MTPKYLYSEDILFVTDIGLTEIIATFEDKHRESADFKRINNDNRLYRNLILQER